MSKGAFADAARFIIQDTIKGMLNPAHKPYVSPPSKYYKLVCTNTHLRHIDAGIGGIVTQVQAGDIIYTQDISIHSVDMRYFIIEAETWK